MIRRTVKAKAAIILMAMSLALVTTVYAETIKWRMTTGRTPALSPFHEADLNFAEQVNRMNGGRLQITVHPAGEIMPAFEAFDAVRKGAVEASGSWSAYWTGKNTAFDLFSQVAYLMHPVDYVNWLYRGGGIELAQELYGRYGLKYLPFGISGPESGFRTNKPIRTIADFKGLNLRIGSLQGSWVIEQLGAKPVRIPGGEVYMALKLGTIDGAEYGPPSTDWGMKLQEITKYVIVPGGWYQPGVASELIVNMEAWNKLPEDLKAIVENAAMANMIWSYAKGNWDSIAAVENFRKAGIKEVRLDQQAQDKIEDLCTMYLEKESARNPDYAKIMRSIVSYLKGFDKVRKNEGRFRFGTALRNYPNIK